MLSDDWRLSPCLLDVFFPLLGMALLLADVLTCATAIRHRGRSRLAKRRRQTHSLPRGSTISIGLPDLMWLKPAWRRTVFDHDQGPTHPEDESKLSKNR
jgi:hypothetical protein